MEASLRLYGIQKKCLCQSRDAYSPEPSSLRGAHLRPQESLRFTPILIHKTSRATSSIITRPVVSSQISKRHREISPLTASLTSRLTAAKSFKSFTLSKEKSQILSTSSLDVSKSFRAASVIKKPEITPRKSFIKPQKPSLKRNESKSRDSSFVRTVKKSSKKGEIEKSWRKIINASNGIETFAGSFTNYSVYVGRGNNSLLVSRLLLRRNWWKRVDCKEKANFVWSQWKDKQILTELSCSSRILTEDDLKPALSQIKPELENSGLNLIHKSKSYLQLPSNKLQQDQRLCNKLEFNFHLTNKKGLFATMKGYYQALDQDIFNKIPVTFTVTSLNDPEFQAFNQVFCRLESMKTDTFLNIWIVKPGEFTNRGSGITVCQSLEEITAIIKPVDDKSYIIQKYIENPLLINKRKFDIRCYAMITSINGVIQGYFYLDGYLRTSSEEYNLQIVSNPFIHLTNDAIQKHSADYGKFENGNKMNYREFQKYLDLNFPDKKVSFIQNILPRMKEIVKDTMLASFLKIDKNRRIHCMEVFGYDFMLDCEFKPWLIEVNTNPCLETSSPHLRKIIPEMLENAFRLAVDPLFPPPAGQGSDNVITNRFELVFGEHVDGRELLDRIGENKKLIEE